MLALLSPNRSGLAVVEDLGLKLFDPGLELLEDLSCPDRRPPLLEAKSDGSLFGLAALADGLGGPFLRLFQLDFLLHSLNINLFYKLVKYNKDKQLVKIIIINFKNQEKHSNF